ncbi:MAG: amidohydrolase family protein [bacterium]
MKRIFWLSQFLIGVMTFTGYAQNQTPSQSLALIHVTVIDATSAPAQLDMTVVITGNRITALGKTGKVKIPQDAQVIDAAGKFLIPGLWDMHAHWNLKEYLPLFIANGVTGARIMWGRLAHHAWRKEIASGALLGPRLIIASPIIDGPNPIWPGSVAVSNAAEARQAVIDAKQNGADFIKVYSLLSREAYFAIVDEAKKHGLPIAGHVPETVSTLEAAEAGQKSIEHLEGILLACSSREAEWRKEIIDAQAKSDSAEYDFAEFIRDEAKRASEYSEQKATTLFGRFVKNGTWQCPTLTVLHSEAFLDDENFRNDARLKFMPKSIKASWDPKSDPELANTSAEDYATAKKVYQKSVEITGAMKRAGVGILAGTDVLNPYCFPGFSMHDELALLVQAGLTPMEALQAATLNPAKYFGIQDSLGTITTGNIADLVLLEANPLADINNTKSLAAVVVNGKLFPKLALQEMLVNIEKIANKKSIADTLFKTITEKDMPAAIEQYHHLKMTQASDYEFGERELNRLGYRLLREQKLLDAIAIFKLNAEAYSQSANVYDSLGEAYMTNGDKALAIESYKKSLALNPLNTNAAGMLKKLKAN